MFRFRETWGISLMAEELPASQEGFCYLELVIYLIS